MSTLSRLDRSPDGAQRNPGPLHPDGPAPDYAALHPGYRGLTLTGSLSSRRSYRSPGERSDTRERRRHSPGCRFAQPGYGAYP